MIILRLEINQEMTLSDGIVKHGENFILGHILRSHQRSIDTGMNRIVSSDFRFSKGGIFYGFGNGNRLTGKLIDPEVAHEFKRKIHRPDPGDQVDDKQIFG